MHPYSSIDTTAAWKKLRFKSWQQHPTRHQLYGHLPPITKTIKARRTRHAGHCWRSKDEIVMYSCGPPHMAKQKQDDQLEHTYSSYVMIRDVTLKTCQRRWTIGIRGERGPGISVLAARHDDDDDSLVFLSWILTGWTGCSFVSESSLHLSFHNVLVKVLDYNIVESSNSSRAITFTFRLISLGKVENLLSRQLRVK